jgi:hypothetical protein
MNETKWLWSFTVCEKLEILREVDQVEKWAVATSRKYDVSSESVGSKDIFLQSSGHWQQQYF